MKKSELRQLIREEVEAVITESAEEDLKALTKLGMKGKVKKSRLGGGINWLILKHGTHTIQIKRYDEPSQYGINNGRISKLYIKDEKQKHETGTGVVVANYDRGWDVKPTDPKVKKLVDQIVKAFK